ncbi:MAG TPA: GyrI-like domain-containing protein [Myxococcaceae bacterium]|nr:GyrI-like domain-containing protein [Myxococcaceae bacterium]
MTKIDFKKVFRALYAPPSREVVRVEVPPLRYLMVDGSGDPNSSPAYQQAVGCLYAVSYTLRFSIKRGPQAVAYGVMPLEGLWWADDMRTFSVERKSEWKWTLMIMQPDPVEASDVSEAIEQVRRKKQLVAVERLRFETFEEGVCAQTLHLGPFSEEGPTIERVHAFIAERGSLRGKHHEIYLSDIRRADPRRWRTVIRQPMEERLPRTPSS